MSDTRDLLTGVVGATRQAHKSGFRSPTYQPYTPMQKLLLIAEIDADSEPEAQEKLDHIREFLAAERIRHWEDITLYRVTPDDLEDAEFKKGVGGCFINVENVSA